MEENNFLNEPKVAYGVEETDTSDLTVMEKPFNPSLIDIDTKVPSLNTLIKRIEHGSIEMDTSKYFQRSDDLWDKTKQSRLIESILIRFPLPAFFFDATDNNRWLIVDGLQRLSTIRNFCVNKTLKLTNLEFLHHLNGKGWDGIGEDLQRVIEEAQVVIYKIMPGTPTDVKFNIFKRINTGGLALEPQEIRHALFQGKPADLVAELSKSKAFVEATSGEIDTHRMLDRNFVNRFLCFYLLGYENYNSDLDNYMNKAMASIYDKSEQELDAIRSDFKKAMILAKEVFGKEAFRKITSDNFLNTLPPINESLFDLISVQFAVLNDDEITKLKKHKTQFGQALKKILEKDGKFFLPVSSAAGDKKRVKYRHEKIKHLIQNTIS